MCQVPILGASSGNSVVVAATSVEHTRSFHPGHPDLGKQQCVGTKESQGSSKLLGRMFHSTIKQCKNLVAKKACLNKNVLSLNFLSIFLRKWEQWRVSPHQELKPCETGGGNFNSPPYSQPQLLFTSPQPIFSSIKLPVF